MATSYLPGAPRPANPSHRAFIGAAGVTASSERARTRNPAPAVAPRVVQDHTNMAAASAAIAARIGGAA